VGRRAVAIIRTSATCQAEPTPRQSAGATVSVDDLRGAHTQAGRLAEWLKLAIDVEDVALRLLAEHKPDRVLKTNVEYYASVVLDGVGLPSDLYTPAFAVARTAGWCAHVLEQAEHGRLIRPDAAYIGPEPRPLPA